MILCKNKEKKGQRQKVTFYEENEKIKDNYIVFAVLASILCLGSLWEFFF